MKLTIYRKKLLVPFFKIIIDFVCVFFAVLFSYYIRFYSPFTTIIAVRGGFIPPVINYVHFALVLGIIFIISFSVNKSYRSRFFTNFSQDITLIFQVSLISIFVGISFTFFYRGFSYSRIVFILIFLNSIIILLLGRFFFHGLKKIFIRKGFNVQRIFLIGSPKNLPQVYKKVKLDENYNFDIQGYLADEQVNELPIKYFGELNRIPLILQNNEFDAFLISLSHEEHQKILQIIDCVEGKNIELFYIPDILDIITSNFNNLEIAGIPVLQLKMFRLSGWGGFIKRVFDILVSFVSVILLSPFFLIILILIKLTSKGPIFFKQKRVTLDNNDFTMIKFRSMYYNEDLKGPVEFVDRDVDRDDPRVTPLGKILRRMSLDELPQLLNVLKGEMSLVGPRPERRHIVEQNIMEVPRYSERHRVRAGITGWSQVNGLRQQNTSLDERIRYDLYYIENWTLWFDLKIIIMTFLEIIRGEEAY